MSTCRSGWSTCSASCCACPAPGTTRPKAWPPSTQPLLPGPGGHVRRRRPHLLDTRLRSTGCWSGCCRRGPAADAGSGAPGGPAVAAAPPAGPGPTAGADHPGPPRPHPRPPPRPPLPGRRAMPLGPGLRPTGVVQDPRPGHPGHPGVAGQPGHHLHQTRRPAGHLRPPGQPRGRLGLRPPRPVAACPGPGGRRWPTATPTPTPAGSAACWPRPPTSRATRPMTPTTGSCWAPSSCRSCCSPPPAPAGPWPMWPAGWTSRTSTTSPTR